MKKEKKTDIKKYTLKEKLLISCLTGFAVSFVLFLFGPVDIYANNMQEFAFTFKDIVLPILLQFVGVAVLISAFLMLFQKLFLNIVSAMILGIVLSGVVENLLNKNPVIMSGDVTELNTAAFYKFSIIYLVIILFCVYASLFLKEKWKTAVIFLCVLLVGMNGSALVADFVNKDLVHDNDINCEYVLSKKGLDSVSEKENIIYILFDRIDTEYVDFVNNKKYPGFFDDLEGFTYFDSAVSKYTRTFPAVSSMLTGHEYKGDMAGADYLNMVYTEPNFLKELKNNGYSVNIYADRYYEYTDAKCLLGIADNVEKIDSYKVNNKRVIRFLNELSVARAFRLYLANYLADVLYSDAASGKTAELSLLKCESGIYHDDDEWMSDHIKETELKTDAADKNFTFIYMHGSHTPHILDENGDVSKNATDITQTVGSFKTVKLYLEHLKKAGVYDNATIIISGDHGIPKEETIPLHEAVDRGTQTAIFIKPKNAKNKRTLVSHAEVSVDNIIPTIISDAKLKCNKNYGESAFDIPENESRTRTFYQSAYDRNSHKLILYKYSIKGNAKDIKNWKLTETIRSDYAWY